MFNDPYCTVSEADEVNSSSEWSALTNDEKLTTLKWARLYLDGNYDCVADDGTDEYDEALKLANALLGDFHAQSNLFTVSDNPQEALITEKSVKAGSVSIGKKYTTGNSGTSKSYDKYPSVTAALSSYCSKLANAFKIKTVIRS